MAVAKMSGCETVYRPNSIGQTDTQTHAWTSSIIGFGFLIGDLVLYMLRCNNNFKVGNLLFLTENVILPLLFKL